MAQTLQLEIVSPAAQVMSGPVTRVEVPGSEGDFGVLPGHAPFFSMLRPGVITLHLEDGAPRRFFATSGYADVTPAQCTILSDHITDLSTVNAEEAHRRFEAAKRDLADAESELEKARATKALEQAQALVQAVKAA